MTAPVNPGDILAGKYLVERVLGVGGMGVVVAARHLQLDERVAIKFLLPESLTKPTLVAKFLREGRLSAKVRSDHVARVRDVGTLESGAPYLVLEYLDGIDLAALLKQGGPLPVETAVEYILHVCEALAEAHAHYIIHRDLKPANLFLTTGPDGSPCVKLIDFGISKLAAGEGADLEVTATVEMRGSPHFMSPEQLMGSRSIDPRSDIWALGVTLHNLLTRGFPFQAAAMPELCAKILQGEAAPLRAALPSAPEALEATILRCLQKEPERRYASVAELAGALRPFAPPRARESVERISKITSRSGSMPSISVRVPAILPAALAPGAQGAGEDDLTTHRITGGRTSGSWAKTGPRSTSRQISLVVVAVAVGALFTLAAGTLVLHRVPVGLTQASGLSASSTSFRFEQLAASLRRESSATAALNEPASPPQVAATTSAPENLPAAALPAPSTATAPAGAWPVAPASPPQPGGSVSAPPLGAPASTTSDRTKKTLHGKDGLLGEFN
jgi:serine/threonine-protein kinase